MVFEVRYALVACAALTSFLAGAAWGSTQFVGARPVPPVVYSGADIGFRVTAQKDDTPVGALVVRVNGEWKDVEFTTGLKRISK